jgi:hypothetical protein
MPAILIEGGFMDSLTDIVKLRDDNTLRVAGYAVAEGVAEYLGLKKNGNVVSTPSVSHPTPPPVQQPTVTTSPQEVFCTANKVIGRVKVIIDGLNIRKGNGTQYAVNRVAQKGEIFDVYANINDWHAVGGANWVFGNNGQYLSLLRDEPVTQPKPQSKKLTYTRLLKVGVKGADVGALQEALNELGFNCGKVDNDFGNLTKSAVVRFQQKYLPREVDGIAGQHTINKLNELL